jgi:hypothetical protein
MRLTFNSLLKVERKSNFIKKFFFEKLNKYNEVFIKFVSMYLDNFIFAIKYEIDNISCTIIVVEKYLSFLFIITFKIQFIN